MPFILHSVDLLGVGLVMPDVPPITLLNLIDLKPAFYILKIIVRI